MSHARQAEKHRPEGDAAEASVVVASSQKEPDSAGGAEPRQTEKHQPEGDATEASVVDASFQQEPHSDGDAGGGVSYAATVHGFQRKSVYAAGPPATTRWHATPSCHDRALHLIHKSQAAERRLESEQTELKCEDSPT